MAEDRIVTSYDNTSITDVKKNPFSIKAGLAQMLPGSAIVKVSTLHQERIVEETNA
ncbi:hypothetical protein PVK06_009468 [Gossypium arboreum]|uniref:Uncharacterized protein n=1 Tax=Gossypium arboreum TaxID=29729 RepID=A0ABR0QMJ9_GOSAR|nr:hypothetical protein PVK06_009468 [Gossypium arboreum]